MLLEQHQGGGRVEGRHGVVAEHDIPALARERLAHRLRIVDALVDRLEPSAAQRPEHELGVGHRVLHDEHAYGVHGIRRHEVS